MARTPNGKALVKVKRRPAQKAKERELTFEFLKSNLFRTVHVDGAVGGVSPHGRHIHMAMYSERRPIPKTVHHMVSATGVLGDELRDKRDERSGIVREVEVDLVLDYYTAVAIRDWLSDRTEQLAKFMRERGEKILGKGE